MEQIIIRDYKELDEYFISKKIKKILLVCGKSFHMLDISNYFKGLKNKLGIEVVCFSEYKPNPEYESVVKGIEYYRASRCDCIVAVGGGSAIDVAKCIKLYANMKLDKSYLTQRIVPNEIPFCVMPTTAGTGSESTSFAVIYFKGEKQSVKDNSCIPEAVYFDASVLEMLPEYQRKATMLDALCHAVESYWSVNSTDESRQFAAKAISMIIEYKELYLNNDPIGNVKMLIAANLAGKAINITQTTAGHAMCYKLTTLYGIAHGHAAALCVSVLWPYMLLNIADCIDPRGVEYIEGMFCELAFAMKSTTAEAAADRFKRIVDEMQFNKITETDPDRYLTLQNGVNLERLKNNPVLLSQSCINGMYHEILN